MHSHMVYARAVHANAVEAHTMHTPPPGEVSFKCEMEAICKLQF